MIELIQVHEPTNTVERVPKKSRVSEHAQFYTKKFTLEDGSEHPYSADINMIYGKQWNKITDSVNKVFGNPDSELKNRKITFQEYADMKTNYDNRMVTDYEKESKPAEPPPLSYTDERGILWRLIGEIPNEHGGKLGRYAPVFSETVAAKPLPWSQRFFRFFGRR